MNKFKMFICERDLIELAHGNMDKIRWYARKPKQCEDSYCDLNSILEVLFNVSNPIKDATKSNKNKIKNKLPDSLSRRDKKRS